MHSRAQSQIRPSVGKVGKQSSNYVCTFDVTEDVLDNMASAQLEVDVESRTRRSQFSAIDDKRLPIGGKRRTRPSIPNRRPPDASDAIASATATSSSVDANHATPPADASTATAPADASGNSRSSRCNYPGADKYSQNVSKYTGQRKEQEWKPEWNCYVEFCGQPPPPKHQAYCKHALGKFWIANKYFNTPSTVLVCPQEESEITLQQQHFIDDLWSEFKQAGTTRSEKGYMLHEIPGRLHVDWNQSALIDRDGMPPADFNALVSASAVLAEPVESDSIGPNHHWWINRNTTEIKRDASPTSAYGGHEGHVRNDPASSSSSRLPARTAAKSTQPSTLSRPIGAPRNRHSDYRIRRNQEDMN